MRSTYRDGLEARVDLRIRLFWRNKLGSTIDDDVRGSFTGAYGDGWAIQGDEIAWGRLVDGSVGDRERPGDIVDDYDVVVTGGDGFEGELDFGSVESPVIGRVEEF